MQRDLHLCIRPSTASASTSVEIVKRIKTRHDDVQIEPKTVRCLVKFVGLEVCFSIRESR